MLNLYDKAEYAKMIFVVGSSRSGTTMLGRIFGKHKDVFMLYELHFFEELYDPRSKNQPLSAKKAQNLAALLFARQRNGYFHPGDVKSFLGEARDLVAQLPEAVTPSLVFAAVMQYEASRNGKTIPVEQTPRNVFYLKKILDLYPQAFIVNVLVQREMDICHSEIRHYAAAPQAAVWELAAKIGVFSPLVCRSARRLRAASNLHLRSAKIIDSLPSSLSLGVT
jgi:hypothetical protein